MSRRPFTPKVITANDLIEGDVVYLSETDAWVRDIAEAEILSDEAHAQLRLLEAEARAQEVVGVYLADVSDTGTPTHFREAFRARGPSNYAHGKQTRKQVELT